MFAYKDTYKQGMAIMRFYSEDIENPMEASCRREGVLLITLQSLICLP